MRGSNTEFAYKKTTGSGKLGDRFCFFWQKSQFYLHITFRKLTRFEGKLEFDLSGLENCIPICKSYHVK